MDNHERGLSTAPESRLAALLSCPGKVTAIFAALSILMTWPLAWRFTTALPYGSGDLWQNYWNFWWWKKALLELHQSPYWTDWLFFPHGSDVIFHTHSPWNMLVALPVTALFGPGAAYNFSLLLALTLSGTGAWLLAREIGAGPRGAFLAGTVFAFFPQHMEQTLEHVNLFSVQFLPWAATWLLRTSRGGGWRNAALLGLLFAFNALCSWHLGLKLILTLAPLAAWALWKPPRPRAAILRDWALAAGVATVTLAPFLAPMIAEILAGATYYEKPPVDRGIDATYLFTPHFAHPLWSGLVRGAYLNRAYQASGFICYLGVVPLALAALALARRKRGAAFWAAFSLLWFVFALGGRPFWAGELIDEMTLPFTVIQSIPLFRLMRVANRFLILTSLGLGMLAALGWSALRRPTDGKFVLLAALVLFEYLWLPYPTQPLEVSPVFARLRDDAPPGAVLDIPFNQRNRTVHNMAAQAIHERKIGGGYLSTFPPEPLEFIARDPELSQLSGVPKLKKPIDFGHLRHLGFHTVILHKYRAESYGRQALAEAPPENLLARKEALRLGGVPDETMQAIREQIERACGPAAMEDSKVAVFFLDTAPPRGNRGAPGNRAKGGTLARDDESPAP